MQRTCGCKNCHVHPGSPETWAMEIYMPELPHAWPHAQDLFFSCNLMQAFLIWGARDRTSESILGRLGNLLDQGICHGLGILLHQSGNLVHVVCALPKGSLCPSRLCSLCSVENGINLVTSACCTRARRTVSFPLKEDLALVSYGGIVCLIWADLALDRLARWWRD